MIKVLVVDDSALMRKLLGQSLRDASRTSKCQFARNGAGGAGAARRLQRPDVITLDIHMPEMDGLACLDRIMIEQPCPVVMVSSLTAEGADATLEALRLGAVDFIAKPDGAISLHIDEFAPESGGEGARRRRRQAEGEPAPEGAGPASASGPAAPVPATRVRGPDAGRARRGDGLVLVGHLDRRPAGAGSAAGARCRPIFPGRS